MIIVQLQGGLGNQMFQYAFARALAERHRVELRLDVRELKSRYSQPPAGSREFKLDAFELDYAIAEQKHLAFFDSRFGKLFNKVIRRALMKGVRPLFNVRLEGYFQCENYFMGNEAVIRDCFRFRPLVNIAAQHAKLRITEECESVAVHVRRGDYVNNPLHEICNADYYRNAMEMIRGRIASPRFFVFSDDIALSKEFIQGEADYIDESISDADSLQLMTVCKHNIIANSSFSWWGAWLGERPGKIVIAPNRWYNDPEWNHQWMAINRIVPDRWATLSVEQKAIPALSETT